MQPVDTALDVALIVFQNGGSTRVADRTFRNILKAYKEEGISTTWRSDFVAASGMGDGRSWTTLRPVGTIKVNLTRASEAVVLGERVARGEVNPAILASELERVRSRTPSRNHWTMVVVAACTSASFAEISGGDWGALGTVLVAAGIGQFLRSLLQARKFAAAPVTFTCGVLSACIAAGGLRLGLTQIVPATLIGSVSYMFPGLPLINGFLDVASQRYLFVGLERIANATFLFLCLAIAIVLAYFVVL